MEDTTNIKDLLKVLQKRWSLVLFLTLAAGIISSVISFYVLTPVYQASTQILVNQKKPEDQPVSATDLQTNVQLINTYSEIIKSPVILEKVIKRLDLSQSPEQLEHQITINSQENSQVFSLTVTSTSAASAAHIANTLSQTFQDEIPKIMNANNVSILSKAILSEHNTPVKPNPITNIVIAMFIGLIVGMGIAFLLEYFNNTIKKEQDIEDLIGLPVLGSISKISPKQQDKLKKSLGSKQTGSESLESQIQK